MIVLEQVTKLGEGGANAVLAGVSATIPTDRRIAVFGVDDFAKTVFIQLLAGLTPPTHGRIRRHARVSFPVGHFSPMGHKLTLRQNVAHVARLHDANVAEVVRFVESVAQLGRYFDRPLERLPMHLRMPFATILTYAVPFDVYLADGVLARGDRRFQALAMSVFEERVRTSGLVLTTNDIRTARKYCDVGAILHRGKFMLHENLEAAIRVFESLKASAEPAGQAQQAERADPPRSDLDDFL